ncbi:Rossmann-like and DUF2520 domain-containing protein [Salinispora fenicalii]|uniref:Rossmann-like and DUF2520 domain-containing protein n=1 Tax=Salinispora fenicalii TaxID=1137263 RepID=UPI00038076EF|nr:DUF2520 domain-containing protein [Salinispora fenicalii]
MSASLSPRPGIPSVDAPTSRSLTVGVIGVGRVGAVLAAAFAAAGHRVVAAAGGSAASQARMALLLADVPRQPATSVARAATDLLLVAVPDDALTGVVAGLAEAGALRPGQVVAHTSGAHGLAVLAPVVGAGASPLALHPAMTFTGTPDDLTRLPGTSYGLTAPAQLRPFATRLVADLNGVPEWVAEVDRPLYHAALVHGANHLITLVNEAADRLRDAGVTQPERVLTPLLGAALDNALRLGDDALTGPIARGDIGTVERHLTQLTATAPESVGPYLALARRTADRVIAAGRLQPMDAQPLLGVLSGWDREVAA